MPELPDIDNEADEIYDFEKIQHIVSALDFLREEAVNTGVEDIKTMIDSTFKIVLSTYTLLLRYECTNNFSASETQ